MDNFIEAITTLQHYCWQWRPDCTGCPFYNLKERCCKIGMTELKDVRLDEVRDIMYQSIWDSTLRRISDLMPKSIKDDIERSLINDCYRKEDK